MHAKKHGVYEKHFAFVSIYHTAVGELLTCKRYRTMLWVRTVAAKTDDLSDTE